jgi:hypothetical protein
MGDLQNRNDKAVVMTLRQQAHELTAIHSELVELKKNISQITVLLAQINQRQIHGLATAMGTGPTSK